MTDNFKINQTKEQAKDSFKLSSKNEINLVDYLQKTL